MLSPTQVKALIPHTWPLFFARHGRFTGVQEQAIPVIHAGRDTLVMAATASGKTEAVLAPLLERNWDYLRLEALSLLYICPTRALVRDLYVRLQVALADSGILVMMKTGDTGPVPAQNPPAILITTPESTDVLLTRSPKLFISLRAVVLDEIHLFDNTPRGDQVRCLLARLERIHSYARPDSPPVQRIALSATIPDPAGVAHHYLPVAEIILVPGRRPIAADIVPLYDLQNLADTLAERATLKSLVFCNSRRMVEETAAYLRRHLSHHAEIFVHYGNLEANVRRQVETRFAEAAVAVCVSTSTLELGVDIGSVDEVVLLGAPPDVPAFMQRIGRGSRRAEETRVLCMPRSPGEWARFEALLALAGGDDTGVTEDDGGTGYGFRPGVLVQQIFSLIKQSPTGSIRRADVRRIAPPEVSNQDIRAIFSHLVFDDYLQPARPGAWKPGAKLQELLDRHDIYTNIGLPSNVTVAVDAYSGRELAQTDQRYPVGTVLLFGGQPMKVVWQEPFRFGLASAPGETASEVLRFQTGYAPIPFAVTQTVARSLGLRPGQLATLPGELGQWVFHFWGSVWGNLLAAFWQEHNLGAEAVNEYCLYVRRPVEKLPPYDAQLMGQVAQRVAVALANRLEMGRFHTLLPAGVAIPATIRRLQLDHFQQQYTNATLTPAPHIDKQLHLLHL